MNIMSITGLDRSTVVMTSLTGIRQEYPWKRTQNLDRTLITEALIQNNF